MSTIVDACVPDIGDFHDVPIIEILVRPGDRVAVGDPLVMLESDKATMEVPSAADAAAATSPPAALSGPLVVSGGSGRRTLSYCGPAVRRMARELGVRLALVRGTGPRGRIIKGDVLAHVTQALAETPVQVGPAGRADLPPWPKLDFGKFGRVAVQALSLSWDHRVVDGVATARFNHFLVTVLGDFHRLVL